MSQLLFVWLKELITISEPSLIFVTDTGWVGGLAGISEAMFRLGRIGFHSIQLPCRFPTGGIERVEMCLA